MKKTLLLIAAPFAFLFALSAQTTQEEADAIVLKRINQDTWNYTIHAKEGLQTKLTVTTSAGEELELDYPCWVYYVIYKAGLVPPDRYLIVNASTGNVLEINAKSNAGPNSLWYIGQWRIVPVGTGLKDTKWKLVGKVNGKTGVLKELEPKDCEECYTLTFGTDYTAAAYCINTTYELDLMHPFADYAGICERYYKDGKDYCDAGDFRFMAMSARYYIVTSDELKLFLVDHCPSCEYFLFKPLKTIE